MKVYILILSLFLIIEQCLNQKTEESTNVKITYQLETILPKIDFEKKGLNDSLRMEIETFLNKHNGVNENRVVRSKIEFCKNGNEVFINGNEAYKGKAIETYNLLENHKEVQRVFKNKEIKVDTFKYYNRKKTYTKKLFADEAKDILGVKCKRVDVIELNESLGIVTNYKMYVTDEVKLPARCLLNWGEEVVGSTALEVKSWVGADSSAYNHYVAIEIKTSCEQTEFLESYLFGK